MISITIGLTIGWLMKWPINETQSEGNVHPKMEFIKKNFE